VPADRSRDPLRERPASATTGLLEYLSSHAIDEDYAFVSARKQAGAARRQIGWFGALVLAAFAVLVVTAAAQTSRNAVSDERERRDLARQVLDARTQLDRDRNSVVALRREAIRLQGQQLASDRAAQGVLDQLRRLGAMTGATAVTGPGVRVVAADAPGARTARNEVLDTDLQKLVNGFWESGAEAVAINGQRLTNLSTIRTAGGAITVNARSLSPPYVVSVIGNKDTLPARFAETASGQAWLDLERDVGLRLTITPVSSLRLPAAPVTLRYATSPTPGGTAR
jgi:uncharacterized protein YlxW (UPF0749 family)